MISKKTILYISILIFVWSCKTMSFPKDTIRNKQEYPHSIIDPRDKSTYGTVEIGKQIWFAENLKFKTPNSICYKKKEKNCETLGRLYPNDELEVACPVGWRVPNIQDWKTLKSNFQKDSIYALLDTVSWSHPINHSNKTGLSIRGVGYQFEKKLFIGEGAATSLWLNQINKYDEYYHVHLYGGEGIAFEKSNLITNEVFHAHPIEDIKNRRFSIRCLCDKK